MSSGSSSSTSSSTAGAASTSPAGASTTAPSSSSTDGASAAADASSHSPPKRRRTEAEETAPDDSAMRDVPQTTSTSSASSAPAAVAAAGSAGSAGAAAALSAAQRDAIRANMARFMRQLTTGCGVSGCANRECVTGGMAPMQPAAALARAQQLYKNHVNSCVPSPAGTAGVAATASHSLAAAAPPAAAASSVVAASAPAQASVPAVAAPAPPASARPSAPAPNAATVTVAAASAPVASAASAAAPPSAVLSTPVAPRPRAASGASPAASPPMHQHSASPAAAAAAASSSSSSRSPAPSPPPSPPLEALFPPDAPLPPLSSKTAPIESVAEWVLQVDSAKTAWEAMGSPPNDLSPFRPLISRLYSVFSDRECLALSFRCKRDETAESKEAEEADADKMTDVGSESAGASTPARPQSRWLEASITSPAIDYEELEAFYGTIYGVEATNKDETTTQPLLNSMLNAMKQQLSDPRPATHPALLRVVPILLENGALWYDPANYDLLKQLTRWVAALPRPAKKLLVSWMSDVDKWTPGQPRVLSAAQKRRLYSLEKLESLLGVLQQFVSVRMYEQEDLHSVAPAIMVMALIHEANEGFDRYYRAIPWSVPRASRAPVPLDRKLFYNDGVNGEGGGGVNLKEEFRRWIHQQRGGKLGASDFSFTKNSFILDAGSKAMLLKYDAHMQQQQTYRDNVLAAGMNERAGYLILEVRRSNLVHDTMRGLANKSSADYKKPLKVHFVGEKGIDAGGLRKEFFQLIIAELFDARYGMFLVNEETRTFRFNPDSLDSPLEFELIGALLGIAIYNTTILDMHFPRAVYKSLLGGRPDLDDLLDSQPSLAKGLVQLLEFDGDVEATFARDFTYSYESWGAMKVVELKDGGAAIPVTNENRHEFVDLYVQFVLEKSIARQFGAFAKGFHRACGGEALKLFRPEELERLVCGSEEFDFDALEAATRYEDGYTKDSPVCKWFWELVHEELSIADKKKLLEFCTGSDRVPIRGLSSLQLTISRQGPDSEQLPTSHTCFNHLLLCEFGSKDKLREKLRLALQNSKGFGLI